MADELDELDPADTLDVALDPDPLDPLRLRARQYADDHRAHRSKHGKNAGEALQATAHETA